MLDLDKSGWETVRLGEVVRPSKEKCDPTDGSVERYVAGEHMDTDDLHIHRWGDVGDGYLGPAFHRRFHPGQVLYGSRRTYLRKVAVADFDGVCANTTFVLDAVPTLLSPRFLPFVMSSEPFHAFAVAESRGSVNPYVNWSDIARFEFSLPPLEEQERIADLLWAMEEHREALTNMERAVGIAVSRSVSERLSRAEHTKRLGDLAVTKSGPSFAARDVHSSPVDGAVPVLGINNTKPDGSIDLTEVGYVTGLPVTTRTIGPASLVMIRTNGNRRRIGNVYRPNENMHGMAVSAFQFLVEPKCPEDRDYLFVVLGDEVMQSRMSDSASGSTGLGNLAVGWLNECEVPWHSQSLRAECVSLSRSRDFSVGRLKDEQSVLAQTRASLLTDVFGGAA